MKIETRKIGETVVLSPQGKITIGYGELVLREAVENVLNEGITKIVVNLEGVSLIDSSGIGQLVASYTRTSSSGGRLVLCNLLSRVIDVLQITGLITVFNIYDSEEEALDSF